jgi:paraquat-inducible protein B
MKKANPAAVGAFVLGGLALAVFGIVSLGGANLFADTVRYVLYFESSVNGLTVGSAVKLQGVEIGRVVEVNALTNIAKGEVVTEVVIEVNRSRFKRTGPVSPTERRTAYLIERGLRGRLELQSIVTGQLYVGLDLIPTSEVHLLGLASPYDELPTVPSLTAELEATVRSIFQRLKDAPLDELVVNLNTSLEGLSKILNSPDLAAAVAQLDDTVGEARGAMRQVRRSFADIDSAVEPDSELRYQLSVALDEIAGAARAVRLLADYIERNPNAVVFGRSSGEQ